MIIDGFNYTVVKKGQRPSQRHFLVCTTADGNVLFDRPCQGMEALFFEGARQIQRQMYDLLHNEELETEIRTCLAQSVDSRKPLVLAYASKALVALLQKRGPARPPESCGLTTMPAVKP